MKILIRDNRDTKDVLSVVERYLTHHGSPHTIIRDMAPYMVYNAQTDLIFSMDGFKRSFPILSIIDIVEQHGGAYLAASVDHDATAFDVLDELQLLWKSGEHLVDGDGPMERCARSVMIATATMIPGIPIMVINCDSQFVSNHCVESPSIVPVWGDFKDVMLPCHFTHHIAQVGNYAIFHDGTDLSLQVVNTNFPCEAIMSRIVVNTNMSIVRNNQLGTITISPIDKGFLHINLDAGAFFHTSEMTYCFTFHKV